MSNVAKVPASDEAWDNGELGRQEAFVKKADGSIQAAIDKSLDLQQISIRLQKSLIEDFKIIAKLNGIGYQTLMRQILKRFAESEKKKILRDYAIEAMEQAKAANKKETAQPAPPAGKRRKAA
jgi:predicted DNA binding CopG/RHH family protein